MNAFNYPRHVHVRRHGPRYADYHSYKDWLRDEFSFRCVFCLRREQWDRHPAAYHIDHIVPRSQASGAVCEYDNLLYVCAGCNTAKSDLVLPNPCQVAFGKCLRVGDDGTIRPVNEEGASLIKNLRLDNKERTEYRSLMLQIIRLIVAERDRPLLVTWMGYPDDLPDLSKKNPRDNSRPEGIEQSYFARRERRELPETY